jgi:hypothetical protein
MAIYGIGAHYGKTKDVSGEFIKKNLVGVGYTVSEAPELYQFIAALKVGDIIYIKSFAPSSKFIFVRAIGFIKDGEILNSKLSRDVVETGRNVVWKVVWEVTNKLRIPKPKERNNVRLNTLYQEFNPQVQAEILKKLAEHGH